MKKRSFSGRKNVEKRRTCGETQGHVVAGSVRIQQRDVALIGNRVELGVQNWKDLERRSRMRALSQVPGGGWELRT